MTIEQMRCMFRMLMLGQNGRKRYLLGESMTHNEVYKRFELYFPQYAGADKVDVWFPNGKNSIRIRQKNKQ